MEWLREQYRTYLRRRPRRQLMPEFFRHQTTDVRVFLDIDSFQRDSGFRPDVVTIGAIYTHRMEFGPRALGTRAILANPARRETHDLLNTRLERSEFMPFAPVIQSENAAQIFDVTNVNRRACRYMTIACDVRPEWRDRVPAVVHVDHSARPQIIDRADNPLYHDILGAFERETGLPVLVNTSFNVHEEPIVNTPGECIKALRDGRIDFAVTDRAI
jgi:carbamoyltransferase